MKSNACFETVAPQQAGDAFAVVHLRRRAAICSCRDLYIPPDALAVFLDAFEGPLDLLLST